MTAEFSRPVALAGLPRGPSLHRIEADATERAALARRLDLPEVHELRAHFTLRPGPAGEILAEGVLEALTTRLCVVSLELFQQRTEDRFHLRFLPAAAAAVEADDDPEAPDILAHDGVSLDLGEVAAEQLALALDPYPRRPDARLEPGDAPATAFAVLGQLRRQ